ncbi:MAG: hypothetical protein FJY77_01180 [Candidatus Altiarchaeales archaeon]|nr:hypothetical protein [Candidatus Altiarchaeales archaeon]
MVGDILGICSKLVQEGIIPENATYKCIMAVQESMDSYNLSTVGAQVSKNISDIGSGMFENQLPAGEISTVTSQISQMDLVGKLLAGVKYLIDYMLTSLTTILAWFGLKFTATQKAVLTTILSVIILVALLDYFVKLFGRWTINSIVGLITLFILHYVFGVAIPLTLFTIIVVAVFGVPGLLAIIVLNIGGII